MKYLSDQHRELMNKMNLLGSGLLVFLAETPKAEEPKAEAKKEEAKGPAEVNAEPKKPDEVAKEAQAKMVEAKSKLQEKYAKEKFDPTETLALARFQQRIDKVTTDYQEKVNKDGDKAKEEAANTMRTSAQNLLDEVTTRIDREEKSTGDKKGPEKNEAEAKKDEYISKNIKALGPALTNSFGFKYENGMENMVKAALGVVDQKTLEKAATDVNFSLKDNLTPQEKNLITTEILNKLIDRNESVNKDEKELVAGLKLEGLKTGADTALNEWISLKYDVTKSPDGKIMSDKSEVDPAKMRSEIIAKLGGDKGETDPNMAATVEANAKGEVMSRQAMEVMQQALNQGEGAEKLGSIEAIGVLIQMYAMLKAGDWESLNEAMADFTAEPPKNPMKVMKECSDAYEKKLGEIAANTPASDLLEAYLKPRGPEANKLFPGVKNGEPPLGRYRGAMCPIIAKQFENQLGISPIEKISREGGTIVIDGNKGNEKVSVHIYKKDSQLMAATGTFETNTTTDGKGKETTKTTRSKPGDEVPLGGVDVKLSDVKLTPATKPATVAETPVPKTPEATVAPAPTLVASAGPSASQSRQGNPGKDQQ